MPILVTGGAGFLGANLVHRLVKEGARVTVLVRRTTDPWRLAPVQHSIDVTVGELADLPGLPRLPKADCIFHCASAAVDQRNHDVDAMLATNVLGTYAVLKTARHIGTRRVIVIGSSGEYGPALLAREDEVLRPAAEYGATKAAGTLLAHAFGRRTGLDVVTLRPFSVFGPLEAPHRLVPYCIQRALAGDPIDVTAGTQTRDYVFVDDVIDAFLAAAEKPEAAGQIVNVCSGVSTKVRDMVIAVTQACGMPHLPRFGAIADNPTEMWTTSGDPSRAKRLLAWQPATSITEGLRRSVEWFRNERGAYSYPG